MTYSVVIRGPLGVGKSTIAITLARTLEAHYISIDRILEDHELEEWDDDRISLRSFLRANAIAADQAQPSLEAGQSVIFDGCFYWREQLDDLAGRSDGGLQVFTLAAPLRVCVERDKTRPLPLAGVEPQGGNQQGEQAVKEVYKLVAEVPCGVTIDASGPAEATAGAILRYLTRRTAGG